MSTENNITAGLPEQEIDTSYDVYRYATVGLVEVSNLRADDLIAPGLTLEQFSARFPVTETAANVRPINQQVGAKALLLSEMVIDIEWEDREYRGLVVQATRGEEVVSIEDDPRTVPAEVRSYRDFAKSEYEAAGGADMHGKDAHAPEEHQDISKFYYKLADIIEERAGDIPKTQVSSGEMLSEIQEKVLQQLETRLSRGFTYARREPLGPLRTSKRVTLVPDKAQSSDLFRKVGVELVKERVSLLGFKVDGDKSYIITEYDGIETRFEALKRRGSDDSPAVVTEFKINTETQELTVEQSVNGWLRKERHQLFPGVGINEQPAEYQWRRLATLLDVG